MEDPFEIPIHEGRGKSKSGRRKVGTQCRAARTDIRVARVPGFENHGRQHGGCPVSGRDGSWGMVGGKLRKRDFRGMQHVTA